MLCIFDKLEVIVIEREFEMTINIGANIRIHKVGLCISTVFLILLYLLAIRESSFLKSKVNNKVYISLKSLLAASIRAAEIGGLEVINVYSNTKIAIENKGKTKEGVDDLVTTADYRSHCAMYTYLTNNIASVKIISEEKSKECGDEITHDPTNSGILLDYLPNEYDVHVEAEDVTVWIDPLDATKEFTENLLSYVSTMVCVAVKGMPTIGVIHKPFESSKTYWAWVNHGFSSNLRATPATAANKNIVVIVSRSHAGKVYNSSKSALGISAEIISAAGAGYKSLELVTRNVTAYVHMTIIKKWDICAGAAIIVALGGTITSLGGEPIKNFDSTESVTFESGLLATMKDHMWYLEKFYSL